MTTKFNKLQASIRKNEKTIGGIAAALAIIMFVSLIEVLVSNLRGTSSILLQPVATAFNGFFWSLYAFGRKDWFILAPNTLAMALGVATAVAVFL